MDNNESLSGLLSTLPFGDDASFLIFNEQLKTMQNKDAIVSFLAGVGGRNARTLTTNILRRILLDDVAELYSLTGKQMKNSSKKSFLNTETCQLIFQTCRKVYMDATEDNLKEIISDWLNQAKVRISRRGDDPKPSTSAAGRPMHEHWHGYKKIYINGKVAAKCFNCLKTCPNTAKARLETHRKKCGSANIAINQLADTEHEQFLHSESDTESETQFPVPPVYDSSIGTALPSSTPNPTISTSTPCEFPMPSIKIEVADEQYQ